MEVITDTIIDAMLCGISAGLIALAPGVTAPEGVYDGRITNSAASASITTTFSVETRLEGDTAFADVTGGYVIEHEDDRFTGSIKLWGDLGGGAYCFMYDELGPADALHLVFAPDASHFTGKWYIQGNIGGEWTGVRR